MIQEVRYAAFNRGANFTSGRPDAGHLYFVTDVGPDGPGIAFPFGGRSRFTREGAVLERVGPVISSPAIQFA